MSGPFTADQLRALWPMIENESVYYAFSTNSLEGSSLTLGETTVILVDGDKITGKPVNEHLDAVDAEREYLRMIELAKARAPIAATNDDAVALAAALHRSWWAMDARRVWR